MLPIFDKFMLLVPPIALAVLLIYTYGLFFRSIQNRHLLNVIMGVVFGFAAAVAMSAPIPIADGMIIDIRTLFIGVAAAYFGVMGGAVTLIAAVSLRISIGGDGVVIGVAGMIITSIMGLLWAQYIRPKVQNVFKSHFFLGLMISESIALGVFFPPEVRINFFTGLAPVLLVANVFGALLLGKLILREQALVTETHRLMNAATTDPLTKLVNRRSAATAFDALPDLHDISHGQSMFCIDVDDFKGINDTYGHLCGDAVLVEISNRLSACLRPEDIISRISGDEFVIVLHAVTQAQAKAVAERCRAAISKVPVVAEDEKVQPSISVGAVWTRCRLPFNALREKADEALYKAKSNGRNCVAFEIRAEAEMIRENAVA